MLAFNIVLGIILLVSFLLILVIMVQQPKSGGLSSSFGGNAQVGGGVKKTGDFLNNSTWTLGVALIFDDVKAPAPIEKPVGTIPTGEQPQGNTQK